MKTDHRKRSTEKKHHERIAASVESTTHSAAVRRENTEVFLRVLDLKNNCLAELGERERRILIAVTQDGTDRNVVCQHEGITDRNMRKILSRALRKVRDCMAQRGVRNEDLATI